MATYNITSNTNTDVTLKRGANTVSVDIGGTWGGATATFYKYDSENSLTYNLSETIGGSAIAVSSDTTFTINIGADGTNDKLRVTTTGGSGTNLILKVNGGSIT